MGDKAPRTASKATLLVGGERVPLNRFTEAALVGVVKGFLGALRDVPAGEVVLTIPADRRASAAESGAGS